MKRVSVVSLQFAPIKANAIENCKKVKNLLENLKDDAYDLIVLPEFFNAGINMTNEEFFEYAEVESNSVVLSKMAEVARKYNSYVLCGSVLFREGKKLLNRSYLLNRHGSVEVKYDKIHLFNYFGGTEGGYTYPGEQVCVAKTDFGVLGLATCFDLRFPEHFLKLVKRGAQIITLPAAWSIVNKATPEYKSQFIKNWRTLCSARALDCNAFFVSSNNAGDIHPLFKGIGNSMIIDFDGKILAQAGETPDIAIKAVLDIEALKKSRKVFPVEKL